MQEVQLLSAAWQDEKPLTLTFPDRWSVRVVEPTHQPALSDSELQARIVRPIGTERLASLAAGKSSAAILVDDITRPTPAADILPFVVDELAAGGIGRDAITVVVASGAHGKPTRDDTVKKIGERLAGGVNVIAHYCRSGLTYLGRSDAGTPLYVNEALPACELKVGIGGIYPHLSAGFSGGSKILAVGACGIKTVRHLHEKFPDARARGGSTDTPFRRELESIARRVGLDFVVNVVLNRERRIGALFAGERGQVYTQAVEYAKAKYAVEPEDADILIADAYPFDYNFQFAVGRGFWPLAQDGVTATRMLLAACPGGMGVHQLFPIARPIWKRALRKLGRARPGELKKLRQRAQSFQKAVARKRTPLMILSSSLTKKDVAKVFSNAQLYREWDPALSALRAEHGSRDVSVAIHRCSPLQVPA